MEQGLNIARRVILDLRKMLPNAWGWEIPICILYFIITVEISVFSNVNL